MKKCWIVLAVLMLAAPAMAADWSFFGSQRLATFYVDRDYGDGVSASGQDDDQATQWFFQGNSRLGAKVKADKVTGLIELGSRQRRRRRGYRCHHPARLRPMAVLRQRLPEGRQGLLAGHRQQHEQPGVRL